MKGLWRSGSDSGVSAPPDAADSPPLPASLTGGAAPGEPRGGSAPPGGSAVKRRRRRRRLLIAAPFLILLAWALVSYTTWMLRPTSMAWQVNSVEWVRHEVPFGNWVADNIERIYYTQNAPKPGGAQLKSLPTVGLNHPPPISHPMPNAPAQAWPPPITPIFPHPLPGEGVWKPTGPPVDGGPPVLVTTFRPELDYPQLVAYVAWFDHTRTEIGYYPGRYEPPNAAVRGPAMVPDDQRSRLLATFNGGFTYTDGAHGLVPTMVGPNPMQSSDRYLVPDDRDFFAVYRPLPGPVSVPFG